MGNEGGLRLRLLLVAAAAVAIALSLAVAPAGAAGLGFEFHHRFSDRVRLWAEERGLQGTWWPEKGTAEYYTALVHHDRARHGRLLSESVESFVKGNATYRISSLGFLHYAFVTLGTPNMTFLVALDTGSDLFWVPCDCIKCAPTSSPNYGNLVFDTYSPSNSSTSQAVLCNNSLCELQSTCPGVNSNCPYAIQYVDGSSTSGVLVEDILYLRTEDTTPQVVEAPIVFGCGEIQNGSFLDSGAPNGLFGLGMDKSSVPSILASKGLTSDSFSMCFSQDGVGRINIGDKGSSDQQETPLILNNGSSHYRIGVTGMEVGQSSMAMSFSVLVDSGTSFTLLADPMYTNFTESFNSQVQETRHTNDPNDLFEFCYDLSPTQTSVLLPVIKLQTSGGGTISVTDPIIILTTAQNQLIYCLAVVKNNINILGQNFLTGHRIVFDRERHILGWKNFDCYKVDSTNNLLVNNSAPSPRANSPSSFVPSDQQNSTIIPVGLAPPSGSSSHLSCATSFLTASLLMLLLAIL